MDHAQAPYIIFADPEGYFRRNAIEFLCLHLDKAPHADMFTCETNCFGTDSYGRTAEDRGKAIGEANVRDVDFEKNEISVNHSVSYYPRSDNSFKCEYEVSEPKTEAGKRTIPMLNKIQDALKLKKENQKKYGYHNVVELGGMSGFIFCNRFGNLQNPAEINRQIKRIVDDYNYREESKTGFFTNTDLCCI